MHVRRITREEVHKLKKRRTIYRVTVAVSIMAVCLIGGAIGFVQVQRQHNKQETKGREITVGTAVELGSSGFAIEDYGTITENVEKAAVDAMEFDVPDTGLPAVEEIQGDNWADEDTFVRWDVITDSDIEAVPLSYFSDSVFIGDSRTEALMLYAGLPNINGFCYKGLSVDKLDTDKVVTVPDENGEFTCYDAISMTSYDNYYLMFGMNELGWIYIEPFIDNFNALIDHIYACNPDAMIYVESILPVSEEESETSDIYTQERIDEFNDALLAMCKERKDVIYLDLAAAVSGEDGYLPSDASVDGIHCNADYCKRLIQYIRYNTYVRK